MPQKKKTNKKVHKKKHINHNNQNIIFQSLPNYSAAQTSGHQYNKNVLFGPPIQQQSRTDNLVGDLVSKLINKIENDKTQQTQQYTKEMQPVTNSNSNSGYNSVVNIYSDGTKKTDETPDKKTTTEPTSDPHISDLISDGVKNAASTAVRDSIIASVGTVLGVGGVGGLGRAAYRNRESIGQAVSRFSTGARNSLSRFSTSAGNRLGRGSEYNGLDRPPPVGAAFEEISEASPRVGTNLQSGSRAGTSLQTGSRGIDDAALNARRDERINAHLRSIREQTRPIEVAMTTTRPPLSRASSIADENAPLLIEQPPLSARSNLSRTSSSSSTRNLINASPAAVRRARNSNPVVEAEITLAPTQRARASGIQEHSGVSTRATRAQTGEPHSQLEYPSKHPDYVSGYDARRRHEAKQKVKQLVPVLNLEHNYNKGYFRKELNQIKEQELEKERQKERLLSGSPGEKKMPKLKLPKKK